jgi:hypothetical protein
VDDSELKHLLLAFMKVGGKIVVTICLAAGAFRLVSSIYKGRAAFQPGEVYLTRVLCFAPVDAQTGTTISESLKVHDYLGIAELQKQQKDLALDEGTPVLVLETRMADLRRLMTDSGVMLWERRVRILEGEHKGRIVLLYDWALRPR